MEFKDYYQILGIERDASQDDIKRAYRRLARRYHPDVSKETDAEARFKEVGEAYEVLKDPEKRAAYDNLSRQGYRPGEEFRPPPGWDAGFEFSGGGFTGAGAAGFSEFFEALFGATSPFAQTRGTRRGFVRRGEDHHARVRIGLEDAFHGATRVLTLQVPTTDAHGRATTRDHPLRVKIPAGITEGQRIRLAGKGGPGSGGAPSGDLYLEVLFEPHPIYEVEGRDVYVNLPITPWEAALGARIQAPTLGGKVDVKIPAGAKTGQRLRLAGRGLPGATPGDEYLVLQVQAPEARTGAQRRLYEEMAQAFRFDPRTHLEM